MSQAEARRRQAEAFSDILMFLGIHVMGRQIGDRGVTYVAAGVEACLLLWILVSGGLSDALGKLLRGRRNRGQYRNMAKLRSSALVYQTVAGLGGSLLLMVLAKWAADFVFRIPYSWFLLIALAPAVFLRTVSAVLAGYFQGEGSEAPRAVAGILRQVFLLGFGILLGHMLGGYGEKVSRLLRQEEFLAMYGGLGIALAVSLAELFVLLFLGLLYRAGRRGERKARGEICPTDSFWDCIRDLYGARHPQPVAGLLLLLPFVAGLLFCGRAAQDPGRLALEYGLYAGKYLAVCGTGAALALILVLPTVARVFQCFRREENRSARAVFQSGAHVCFVHGVFLSVYAAAMGAQIGEALCPENVELVAKMLQGGSFLIAFAPLSWYFCRFLHSMGWKSPVLLSLCGADILFFLVAVPSAGRLGALSLVYGGLAGSFLLCVLSGGFAHRQLRARLDLVGFFAVPLGAGAVAGLLCLLVGRFLAPHLGSLMALLLAFLVAGGAYWLLLLLLRNFKEQELEVLCGGRLLGMLGRLLGVY